MEVSDQLHASSALPPRREPWYPLDRRLGGLQNQFGHGGEETFGRIDWTVNVNISRPLLTQDIMQGGKTLTCNNARSEIPTHDPRFAVVQGRRCISF
jgi:hypothetical protein